MDITWLGHSCFRLKARGVTVVTDPFDETSGYNLGRVAADIVTISHDHPHHNSAERIDGSPKVLRGPGEYEIAGVFTYGIRTFHDSVGGAERGKNTTYIIEIDEVKVCHLGDLGHMLSASQIEEVSDADVLLVPVGGISTIDATAAAELANLIDPRIVIPMHFRTPVARMDLEPVDRFLKETGLKEVSPVPRLAVSRSGLPAETQIVVMSYGQ